MGIGAGICVTKGRNKGTTNDARAEYDFYATPPQAVEDLLQYEGFTHRVWEPCCGLLHISNTLKAHCYDVRSSDVLARMEGIETLDFFSATSADGRDIITNPPYIRMDDFICHAMEILDPGGKMALFLKLDALETKKHWEKSWSKYPPSRVYVPRKRYVCARNGEFSSVTGVGAVVFAWYIFEKGVHEPPRLYWIEN